MAGFMLTVAFIALLKSKLKVHCVPFSGIYCHKMEKKQDVYILG